MQFEWDSNKAIINFQKHDVSFEEAITAFNDEYGILFDDPSHSLEEERYILLGMSSLTNLLIVCHCYRAGDEIIRIVSARKATANEENQYKIFNKRWGK